MSRSEDEFVCEGEVSGNQANIPAYVRRELDIDDGDQLRWVYSESGELRVEVVHQREGTFADFDGYEGGPGVNVVEDHDAFGIETDEDSDGDD